MDASHYRQGKALRVFWADSTHTNGWQYAYPMPVPVEEIVSVGLCAGTSADGLNLTTSISKRGGILSFITIPWIAIQSIQDIEEWDLGNNYPDGFDETENV